MVNNNKNKDARAEFLRILVEAEEAVLGCMLINIRSAVSKVVQGFR